jgi:hypothetical protein
MPTRGEAAFAAFASPALDLPSHLHATSHLLDPTSTRFHIYSTYSQSRVQATIGIAYVLVKKALPVLDAPAELVEVVLYRNSRRTLIDVCCGLSDGKGKVVEHKEQLHSAFTARCTVQLVPQQV